nr:hypothetical protein [uncultured Halomonas sp.]
MAQQPRNPLSANYVRQEYPGLRKNKISHKEMVVPDNYHKTSEIPLRKRIEDFKNSLHDNYVAMVLGGIYKVEEIDEEEVSNNFNNIYSDTIAQLRSGIPATEIENKLEDEEFSNMLSCVVSVLPRAMTWLACADLLEESNLIERSWSTLLEFKGFEHDIKTCEEKSMNFNRGKEKQKFGGYAYSMYGNLKESFIELLSSHAPSKGWETKANAASTLAAEVYERHIESDHKGKYPITKSAVETKLKNWLKNGVSKDVASAYEANKKN